MELRETPNTIQEIQRRAGRKPITFVSGNFNILHPGHMRLISFAKQLGGFLVVGVNPDSTRGVVVPIEDRINAVRSLSDVDFVFDIREPLDQLLAELRPFTVVKGKEHEGRFNLEKSVVGQYGGRLIFSSGESKFSSLDLIRSDFAAHRTLLTRPTEFLDRHGLTPDRLFSAIDKMQGLSVLVVGDTIVDEYVTCEAIGLSQEDPTIVVSPLLNHSFVGGAGIVASHASGLGAKVDFFSVVGRDDTANFARDRLVTNKVNAHLFTDDSRPTTLKQRFRTQEKTLLRVNRLSQRSVSDEMCSQILESVKSRLDQVQLLIFSDFNYGCLPQRLVDAISAEAASKGVMMVADSQSSSQIGDITRFKNMSLITPTEREARIGVRDFDSGLVVLAEKLVENANSKHVFITLGAEGLLIFGRTETANGHSTDKIPALNSHPKDISGAGDSMLVSSAMALAAGENIWTSALIGSLAAGCQVGRVGNIPLSTAELIEEISH